MDNSIIDSFSKHFSIRLATTQLQKEDAYRIRYRTYVEEFGFEDKEQFSNTLEIDEYDTVATTCIIYHNYSSKPAACIRLISANDCELLPVEKYCKSILDTNKYDKLLLSKSSLCEASRLVVDKDFRRRHNEHLSPIGHLDGEERTYPLLSIACFLSMLILSEMHGTPNCIAVMEPFLPRLTKRSGINFEPIGTEINYHGIRVPYLVRYEDVMNNLSKELRVLLDYLRNDIQYQVNSVC